VIADLVRGIEPFDDLERSQLTETLAWVSSGVALFRLQKPATPKKHLVAYFLVIDIKTQAVLLVHHRKAEQWLPTGGHIEPDEHPATTVIREAREELQLEATFVFPNPVFLSVSETVGRTAPHTDVSLWYVLHGDSSAELRFDAGEFLDARWFSLNSLARVTTNSYLSRCLKKIDRVWIDDSE
jgi:8-oxo-dGTP diphosphatase